MNLFLSLIFIIGLGCFLYRIIQFIIFVLNPLPGEDLKWHRQPQLGSLIKSRKLKKKNLLDFLMKDRIDNDQISIKEQSFPMNSVDEENLDEDLDQMPDIEINLEDIPRSQRIPTSSPKQIYKNSRY